jgi:hypothetical protein
MGQFPLLKCLMSGARECLWLHSIMPGFKLHYSTRTQPQWFLLGSGELLSVTTGGLSWVTRRIYGGIVDGKILTVHRYHVGREGQYRSFPGLIFLGWWLLFSQEWWDRIW